MYTEIIKEAGVKPSLLKKDGTSDIWHAFFKDSDVRMGSLSDLELEGTLYVPFCGISIPEDCGHTSGYYCQYHRACNAQMGMGDDMLGNVLYLQSNIAVWHEYGRKVMSGPLADVWVAPEYRGKDQYMYVVIRGENERPVIFFRLSWYNSKYDNVNWLEELAKEYLGN